MHAIRVAPVLHKITFNRWKKIVGTGLLLSTPYRLSFGILYFVLFLALRHFFVSDK